MNYLLIIGLIIIAGCGQEKAKNGEPGKNASCITVEKDGEIFLRCATGDGLITETSFSVPKDGKDGVIGKDGAAGKDGKDGLNGRDGQDAIVGSAVCKYEWPASNNAKNDLTYTVFRFQSGDELHGLIRKYSVGEYSSEKSVSVNWPAGIEGKYAHDGVFTASYKGECFASVSMKTSEGKEIEEMKCECRGKI